jgi:hypothetical protein
MDDLHNKLRILSVLTLIVLFIWYFSIRNIVNKGFTDECNNDNCNTKPCYQRYCKSGDCKGNNCRSGDCYGEYCIAGNCYGKNCKAGNCYGYGCSAGICYDPDCDSKTCPQINKGCTDGKAFNINRPFYYKYTKNLPNDTFINPPLCDRYIRFRDLKEGRTDGLDLLTVNIYNRGTIPYSQINNNNLDIILNTQDNDIISGSVPYMYKNDNCEICTRDKCHQYKVERIKGKFKWIPTSSTT